LTDSGAIPKLILQARKRVVWQLALEQFGWGAVAGLAALLVLLLVGTQVLNWYWPVLLLLLTAGFGWWRSRRLIPEPYSVAQRLDRSLGLRDLLSTAFYFHHARTDLKTDEAFLARVIVDAEKEAQNADPRVAIPFQAPRSAWPAVAMLLAATVVFFIRYGMLHSFDLRPPIAAIQFDTLSGAQQTARKAPAEDARKSAFPEPYALTLPEGEQADLTEKDNVMQESLRTVDVNGDQQSNRQGDGQSKKAESNQDDNSGDDSPEGENASSGKEQSPAGAKDGRKPGDPNSQKQGPQEKNNSLMNKMRDALANLMDKMKMEQKGEQQASNKGNQKGQGQKGDQKGQQQSGKPDQQGNQDSNQPGDKPGESENAQQAKSNQAGNSPEQPSSNEKSGIGKQDGSKDTELAEQKDAMGKLSELLGKRSLNLQGEVMVEVTNSKNQQLKTPYVNRSATHIESGGEINRDEVPLHLQDYVKSYYEKVRKQAPPAAPANTPAPPASKQ